MGDFGLMEVQDVKNVKPVFYQGCKNQGEGGAGGTCTTHFILFSFFHFV